MRRILFDTSVYIKSLRSQDDSLLRTRTVVPGTALWLSSVVLEELYAGARVGKMAALEKLERDFRTVRRLLVPDISDWVAAGRILAKIGAKYGFDQIGRARLTNDTLIGVSAARSGVRILTTNPKDFARIAEFRQFEWEMLQDPRVAPESGPGESSR